LESVLLVRAGVLLVAPVVLLAQTDANVRQAALARVSKARAMAAHPEIVGAVAAKNAQSETAQEIQARDRSWSQNPKDPLRAALTRSPCGERLRSLVADDPTIVEVILTDAHGANVCVSRETSDYWQGDEAKWEKPFKDGVDPFVDAPAFDASTGTFAIQMSVPVHQQGQRVGALTLTLKVQRERR
jgi:hypothetical protein